jgi:hypothetical protein
MLLAVRKGMTDVIMRWTGSMTVAAVVGGWVIASVLSALTH